MAFPRIDHPEFAEFIRRFYGITRDEHPTDDRHEKGRPEAHATAEGTQTTAGTEAGRHDRSRRAGITPE